MRHKRYWCWWVFVLCIIVASGLTRFEARRSSLAELSTDSLIQPTRDLLLMSGAIELKEIHYTSALVGHQFRYQGCEESMKVIEFQFTLLARTFADYFVEENHTYVFQYLGYTHSGSSRMKLYTVWALNKLKNAFNLSSYRQSKKQLVILWPVHCDAPRIDWSFAWRKSKSAT